MVISFIYYMISMLSIILYVMSVQFKKKKDILITQTAASICYFIVYVIKCAWSGVAIEILEEIKNIVFLKLEKKYKKIPIVVLIIFLFLLVSVSIMFYDGIFSLLPLIINLILFISTYFKNPKVIRVCVLICGVMWFVYNMSLGAYIISIGNILEIVSATVALIRYKK